MSRLTIKFVNRSAGATSFLWDFGDGTTSTEASPAHDYPAGGAYIATLTAIGPSRRTTSSHVVLVVGITDGVESVHAGDESDARVSRIIEINESVAATDTVEIPPNQVYSVGIIETTTPTDSSDYALVETDNVFESATTDDIVDSIKISSGTVAETIATSDSPAASVPKLASIVETVAATETVVALSAETMIWRAGLATAGGNANAASVAIADNLIVALKAQTFYGKIKYLLPLLGQNLAAARMPLIDALSVGIAGNTGFVDGDFSEATGLQGNGTSKILDSLIKPNQLGVTNNGGLGYWETKVDFTGTSDNCPIGIRSTDTFNNFQIELYSTNSGFYWGLPANATLSAGSATNGHYYGQRSVATSRGVFINGVSKSTNATSDAAAGNADYSIRILGKGYSTIQYWKGRCAAAYLTDGTLTNVEVTALHSVLNTYLMEAAGRLSGRVETVAATDTCSAAIVADALVSFPFRARWTPASMSSVGSTFTWTDVSGNGYNATRSSTLPTIGAGINSQQAVVVDGNDHRLAVSPISVVDGLSQFSIFCVFKTPSTAPVSLMSLFGSSNFSGANTFNVDYESTAYPATMLWRVDNVAGTEYGPTSTVAAADTWYYLYAECDGTTMRASINGVFGSNTVFTGALKAAPAAFYLLGTNYAGFYMKGQMHELAFFNACLTAPQLATLQAYALSVYGLANQAKPVAITESVAASDTVSAITFTHSEVSLWYTRLVAAGGQANSVSISVAGSFLTQIKTRSYYTKMRYLLPMLGQNLAAARTPLIDVVGVGIATNIGGMVDADFNEALGLSGSGGKRLDTLVKARDVGIADAGGAGYWEKNYSNTGWIFSSGVGTFFGLYLDTGGYNERFHWGNDYVASSTTPGNHDYYGQSVSTTNLRLYRNGALIVNSSGARTTTSAGAASFQLFGNQGVSNSGRCAVAYMTDGTLSDAEVTDLHNDLTTYLLGGISYRSESVAATDTVDATLLKPVTVIESIAATESYLWLGTLVPESASATDASDGTVVPANWAMSSVTDYIGVYALYRKVTAYTGPLYKIRRASDNLDVDCYTPEAAVAHIGGSTGFLSAWYDQTGRGAHFTEASTTVQPQYIVSDASLGGKPSIDLGTTKGMTAAAAGSLSGNDLAIVMGYIVTGAGYRVLGGVSANWLMGPYSAVYNMYAAGFSSGPAVVLNAPKINTGYRLAGAALSLRVDGYLAGTAGMGVPNQYALGVRNSFGEAAGAKVFELLTKQKSSTLTMAEVQAMETLMNNYYLTTSGVTENAAASDTSFSTKPVSITETVTIGDLVESSFQVLASAAADDTASATFISANSLTETVTIADTVANVVSGITSEPVAAVDSATSVVTVAITETAAVSDTVSLPPVTPSAGPVEFEFVSDLLYSGLIPMTLRGRYEVSAWNPVTNKWKVLITHLDITTGGYPSPGNNVGVITLIETGFETFGNWGNLPTSIVGEVNPNQIIHFSIYLTRLGGSSFMTYTTPLIIPPAAVGVTESTTPTDTCSSSTTWSGAVSVTETITVADDPDTGVAAEAETTAWIAAVTAASGTTTAQSRIIANNLVLALKRGTYYSKIKYMLPFLGSAFDPAITAANSNMVPLIDTLSVGNAYLYNGGEASRGSNDTPIYRYNRGMRGDTSGNAIWHINLKPSQLGSGGNGGLGIWLTELGFYNAGYLVGAYTDATSEYYALRIWNRELHGENFRWAGPNPSSPDINAWEDDHPPATLAHYYGQRSSSTSRKLYRNAVEAGSSVSADSITNIGVAKFNLFNLANSGVFSTHWSGVFYFTDGTLTPTEITALHDALRTYLMIPTGRI